MFRLLHAGASRFRTHPWVGALVLVLLFLLSVGLGGNLYAWYHFRAARIAREEERYTDARQHLDACAKVWRNSYRVHLLAARVARLVEDYADAERHLNACKQIIGDTSAEMQTEWLLMRAQSGEADDLLPGLLTSVDKGDPASELILETLARTWMRDLRFGAAMYCLDRWLKLAPDTVRALDWRGWVLEKLMRDEEAVETYERVIELAPDRIATRIRLFELFLRQNKPEEARAQLEYLRRHQKDSLQLRYNEARLEMLEGDSEHAAELLDGVLDENPDHLGALLDRARVALTLQHPAQAEGYLRRAERLAPNDLDVLTTLSRCLRQQPGRQSEADRYLARYRKAERDRKRLVELLNQRNEQISRNPKKAAEVGKLLLELGVERAGVYWLETAVKQDDSLREAHAALARYYEDKKLPDKAAEHRRKADAHSGSPARP